MSDALDKGEAMDAAPSAAAQTTPVLRRSAEDRATVVVREDVLTKAAAVAGFVAGAGGVGAAAGLPLRAIGLGRRTPTLKGTRMRNRRRNAQLAPAMHSLAATNAQLLGLVGSRHPLLNVAKLGVAAAGVAYLTADEAGRKQMLDQATGLIEQGASLVSNSGLLDKIIK